MSFLLAAAESGEIHTLFVILAFAAFALALYLGYRRDLAAAAIVAFIGVLVLVFAL